MLQSPAMDSPLPAGLAIVVADAPIQDLAAHAALLAEADLRVAADGGARHLLQAGLLPHAAIGDFDSLPPAMLQQIERQGVEIQRHSPRKDETDLELALLYALAQGASRIIVLAALGGRPDQHLANLQLLVHPALAHADVRMLHAGWEVFAIRSAARVRGARGQIVSLLPMSNRVEGIVTEGLHYPLRDEALDLGPARGVSNVMEAEHASITVRSGVLLAMHQLTLAASDPG